jgi:chromosome segregation ATPase
MNTLEISAYLTIGFASVVLPGPLNLNGPQTVTSIGIGFTAGTICAYRLADSQKHLEQVKARLYQQEAQEAIEQAEVNRLQQERQDLEQHLALLRMQLKTERLKFEKDLAQTKEQLLSEIAAAEQQIRQEGEQQLTQQRCQTEQALQAKAQELHQALQVLEVAQQQYERDRAMLDQQLAETNTLEARMEFDIARQKIGLEHAKAVAKLNTELEKQKLAHQVELEAHLLGLRQQAGLTTRTDPLAEQLGSMATSLQQLLAANGIKTQTTLDTQAVALTHIGSLARTSDPDYDPEAVDGLPHIPDSSVFTTEGEIEIS